METDLRAAALETLRKLADGKKRTARENVGWDMDAVKRLRDAGLVTGRDASDADGPEFIELSITQRGAAMLADEMEKQKNPESRDARYYRSHPIRANIVVAVASSLITALVIWAFSSLQLCS